MTEEDRGEAAARLLKILDDRTKRRTVRAPKILPEQIEIEWIPLPDEDHLHAIKAARTR